MADSNPIDMNLDLEHEHEYEHKHEYERDLELEEEDEKRHGMEDVLSDGQARASLSRLYLMVASDFGLFFTLVVKYALTTPYLSHTLGAGPVVAHGTWILGPLSGLITAPIVGVLSDRCRLRYGRRRPFMVGGVAASVIGMALFAGAKVLPQRARLPTAIVGFGVLDFAGNVVMFPSRALLGDLLPAAQQHDAQSAAAVLGCAAEIAAGGFLLLLRQPLDYIHLAFGISAAILCVTTAISVKVCVERPIEAQPMHGAPNIEFAENDEVPSKAQQFSSLESDESAIQEEGLKTNSHLPSSGRSLPLWREVIWLVGDALSNFPRALVPVGLVYGLGWLGWYCTLPWFSVWLGSSVMGGSSAAAPGTPAAVRYQRGVSLYAGASAVKAVLSLAFSAIYPRLLRLGGRRGEALMFSMPFLAFAVALAIVADTRSPMLAAAVVVLGGIPFIATQTIPIAIVVQHFPERLASNLGVLNLFCVIPQMIDTVFTGFVAESLGYSTLMLIGAAFALAAGLTGLAVL